MARVVRLAIAAAAAAVPARDNASAAIRATYFSQPAAAGADAIDEAVAWLADQEAMAARAADAPPPEPFRDPPGGAGRRVCAVTHDRIAAEGTFARIGGGDQGSKRVRNSQLQKAPISVDLHAFRLIFGRAVISRSGVEA